MSRLPLDLRRSTAGSAAVEFALLAPLLFALLLGVFQIGMGMQAYNALRSIAADTGRNVAVEFQKSNPLSNAQVQQIGTATAVQAPYMLDSANVVVTAVNATPQRVAGAREITLTINYTVPSVLRVIGLPPVNIRYSRPIFVLA